MKYQIHPKRILAINRLDLIWTVRNEGKNLSKASPAVIMTPAFQNGSGISGRGSAR